MIYLTNFKLLNEKAEHDVVFNEEKRYIFNSSYPIGLFSRRDFTNINFDDITIFYGGNGSGKTTLLNIISQKLAAQRKSEINKGQLFDAYVNKCSFDFSYKDPIEIKAISSDDVFDYLLDIRSINNNVNRKKDDLAKEWLESKYDNFDASLENYERLKKSCESRKKTMSRYIRERLRTNNMIEQSNGESALLFWEREIKEDSIYILDEPENSLSAENQLKLKKFIEESVRFYNCQFIISTHSPFLLNLNSAKIYNLDEFPVTVKKWTELPNVKLYYDFFKERSDEFN